MPQTFAQLVSLACHDVRTPLATVYGFARTLERAVLPATELRYVGLISESSLEISEILDRLSLAARIEAGRWEPELADVDSGEVAVGVPPRVTEGQVNVAVGRTTLVRVDGEEIGRSLASLARCVLRHGDLQRVGLSVSGATVELRPVDEATARVVLGEELKDFGAAVAVRAIDALGGSVAVESDALRITLPTA
jgi:signal transduction histidine kinase